MRNMLPDLALLTLLAIGSGCERHSPAAAQKTVPPARVEGAIKEADLVKVKLTAEAEKRLGIETVLVERKPVERIRSLGAEVIVPHGRQIQVTAPLAGTVLAGNGSETAAPGTAVRKGQVVFRLSPVLAGEREVLPPADRLALIKAQADLAAALVEAEGNATAAEVRLETSRINMDRADQLKRQNAGSLQAYDQAQAELRMAEAGLKAARARLEVLKKTSLEARPESVPVLNIESPQDGVIRSLLVTAGQKVGAGGPLFEVIAIDPLWVRVPVYVGELNSLDLRKETRMKRLSDGPATPPRPLKPVQSDPSADPLAATADLFFEVTNTDNCLRPGERVIVLAPTSRPADSLVLPLSAVVYDFQGGSWVYENPEPQTFVRRRVEIRDAIGGQVVLNHGPAEGTRVVSTAAAELFGTEFGIGK